MQDAAAEVQGYGLQVFVGNTAISSQQQLASFVQKGAHYLRIGGHC